MIRYSQRNDLPSPIIRALEDPYYSEGLSSHFRELEEKIDLPDLSVTTLPRSARQRQLFIRHSDKIVLDPLSGFWKMFGHTIHAILESHGDPGDMIEERMGVEIAGYYIHGQADRYVPSTGVLQDYKITKAESLRYGPRIGYIAQLNILAWIWRAHGHAVNKIQNVYLLRNWDSHKAHEGSWYPKEQIVMSDVPMWTDDQCKSYVLKRIAAHASSAYAGDDDLPFCSDEERWVSDPAWRVVKIDPKTKEPQKKAKARFATREEAEAWLMEPVNAFEKLKVKGKNTDQLDESKPINYIMQEVKAAPGMCAFCEISQFCNQRRDELALEAASGQSTDDDDDS